MKIERLKLSGGRSSIGVYGLDLYNKVWTKPGKSTAAECVLPSGLCREPVGPGCQWSPSAAPSAFWAVDTKKPEVFHAPP